MRETLLNLFKYSYEMNLQEAKKIIENPASPPDALRLLSHIIGAQKIWLSRLAPDIQQPAGVWDMYEKEQLEAELLKDYNRWKNYLENIKEEDLSKIFSYKNTKGDAYENRIGDVLFHVANHATHHRGQISLLLRQNDIVPPITDYIFYMRNKS